MINITLGVVLGSPSMKYPKNGFKIINITQIPKMNPARGFCFIVQWENTSFVLITKFKMWLSSTIALRLLSTDQIQMVNQSN